MKQNLGPLLALYPMPLTVIGAMAGEKPTWTLAAHVGILGHDRVMVSLAENHYVNKWIRERGVLSIHLVEEAMLPQADYAGSVSGAKVDKSGLFAYTIGEEGAPILEQSPLSMVCTVVDVYKTPGFESFICRINATYGETRCLNGEGRLDYRQLKPVLFQFPTYEYLATGEVLGKCLTFRGSGAREQ